LLFGKQLSFWGGLFGTVKAHFSRPGAPNTPHRKAVVGVDLSSSFSIGWKMILMFLGIGILAWETMPQATYAHRWINIIK
jgi:hypothetical protein